MANSYSVYIAAVVMLGIVLAMAVACIAGYMCSTARRDRHIRQLAHKDDMARLEIQKINARSDAWDKQMASLKELDE